MVEERSGRTALKPALSETLSRLWGDCMEKKSVRSALERSRR